MAPWNGPNDTGFAGGLCGPGAVVTARYSSAVDKTRLTLVADLLAVRRRRRVAVRVDVHRAVIDIRQTAVTCVRSSTG